MSSSPVPRVRFDQLMKRVDRKVILDDATEYDRVGVRWYGNGAFVRDRALGADIARKQQWIIHEGDVVYNKLFAWKGAFAVADKAVDGRIVSDKFPTYEVDRSLVEPRYLAYFFRTQGLARQAEHRSKGAAAISKLTLNPPQFWDITIPLPSLPDQKRLIERLNEIASRVDEALIAKESSRASFRALGGAFLRDHSAACTPTPLGEVLELRPPDVRVEPDVEYRFAGVYSFGRGVFQGPVKRGSEFSYEKLTRLAQGEFVYPKLMAWEGAFGVASIEHEGLVVSPEFPVFRLDSRRVLPETLGAFFAQPDVWSTLAGTSRGTNVRRRRLHPRTLLAHVMPLPTMDLQLTLRAVVARTRELMPAHVSSLADLEALMPSVLDRAFEGELNLTSEDAAA